MLTNTVVKKWKMMRMKTEEILNFLPNTVSFTLSDDNYFHDNEFLYKNSKDLKNINYAFTKETKSESSREKFISIYKFKFFILFYFIYYFIILLF